MSNFLNKIPVSPITSFGNPSVPNGSTIGTNFSILQTGGFMEVYTLSGLTYTIPPATTGIIEFSGNSIPIQLTKGSGSVFSPDVLTLNSDNISSGRRKLGMLAYVYETNKIYQFRIDNYDTLWNNATGATGPGGSTVVISNFGTTVKNNSAAGIAFINAWTASTISGINGYDDTNASWRVLQTGGGAFTGGTVTGATIFTNGLTANTISAATYLNLPIIPQDYLPLSGGTVTGATIFTNGLTANTISATTYQNLPATPFLPLSGGTVTGATSFTGGLTANTISATTYYNLSSNFQYEIHVSQVDGSDTTGDGGLLTPVATITKALTLITGLRRTIIVHPGGYTENPSITVQYTSITGPGLIGGNIVIYGTISTNTGCSISGLKMTNLNITAPTGTGNVNVLNCDISGTLTKSSSADYTLIRFCDIGTTNITSSGGLVAIFGGNPNFITINNVFARVIVKNAVTVAPVLTAGNANFVDSILLSTGLTSNAITTSVGTIVTLANSQIIVPTFNNVARVSLSGLYSIFNCVYDKPNSTLVSPSGPTLTSGSTNSIDYFQYINADKFITQGGTSSKYVMGDGSLSNGFTGGTVTGATIFTGGLTANTISATTYQNLPATPFLPLSGGTVSGATTFTNGLTANTISATTYQNLPATPFLPLSGGTVTGGTIFTSGVTANTISATTYQNLPQDIFVTGGTYTSGNAIFTNNSGGTFTVSGFPIGSGGGQIFYLNLSQSQNGNRLLSTTASTASEQSTGVTIGNGVTSTIASFQSQPLNTTLLPGGIWSFYLHSYKQNTNASFNIFVELYKITSGGTQTLLFTTDPAPVTTNSPNPSMQLSDGYFSGTPLSVSDGVVAVVKATNTSNQSHTITLFTEGSQHYSYVVSTIPTQQGLTCDTLSGCSIIQTIQTNVSNKLDKSGGTITGNLIINSGLTANTISATTYQNLPTDIRVTGATYSNNTFTYTNNTGGTFSVLFNTVTGLTVNGNLTVTGTTTSTTISATTYQNLPTDIRVTGGTYSNNTFTYRNNTGGTFSVLFNTVTGLTANTLTVTGNTSLQGVTATTISATTYQNLPSITGLYLPISGGTVTGQTHFSQYLQADNGLYATDFNTNSVYSSFGYSQSNDFGDSYFGYNNNSTDTYNIISFNSTDTSDNHFGSVQFFVNPESGLFLQKNSGGNTDYSYFTVTEANLNFSIFSNSGLTNNNFYIYPEYAIFNKEVHSNDAFVAPTFSATTYRNLPLDIRVTGGTYSNGTATFRNNTGGTFNVTGFSTSTGTSFTGGTVSGATNFTGGLTANTISATTYQNLPTDIRVTGGTYSSGSLTFTNNTGGTFNVTGLYTGGTDVYVTGGTFNKGTSTLTFTNITGGTFNVTGLTDVFVTGGTYSGSTIIFTNNTGGTFNVTGITTSSTFTGGTVTGATNFTGGLTANTISATTYQNLPSTTFTGGTVSGATIFTGGLTANTITPTSIIYNDLDYLLLSSFRNTYNY
jgi:hypothetical protein